MMFNCYFFLNTAVLIMMVYSLLQRDLLVF